jgi:protein-tyrosine phosphatase
VATTPAGSPPLANLRDVGGHPVADGGRVRTGLLYRSVDLGGLGRDGLVAVGRLGIRTVYDLRTADERAARPDRLPDGSRVLVADVLADAAAADRPFHLISMMQDVPTVTAALVDGGAVRYFEARYREFVHLASARRGYGAVFRDLAAAGSRPGLVHCTTGKDRTGWAVAALLLLLRVPEASVLDDYLASNAATEALFARELEAFRDRGGDPELLRPLTGVRASYLEAALAEVRKRFGDVDAYFGDGLGVDAAARRALRKAFLDPS